MDNTHFHRRAREETFHSPSVCVHGLRFGAELWPQTNALLHVDDVAVLGEPVNERTEGRKRDGTEEGQVR